MFPLPCDTLNHYRRSLENFPSVYLTNIIIIFTIRKVKSRKGARLWPRAEGALGQLKSLFRNIIN